MKIVVDAMGGDHAPGAPVAAAFRAAAEGTEIVLVGRRAAVMEELSRIQAQSGGGPLPATLQVHDAPDVIRVDEPPVAAVRKKRDSSLVCGLRLVKEGSGDAFVSAGSTGALMAGGLFTLGRIKGIQRPALGQTLPTTDGRGCFVLDLGAGTDCRPQHLVQFAHMGDSFVRLGRGLESPRVALINVGAEEVKGTEAVRRAFALLKSSGLNFIGNIEARHIMHGACDVAVCDGFVGNILVKFAEGMAGAIFGLLKDEARKRKTVLLGALLMKPALKEVKRRLDYAEYGGAPLLGLAGVVMKCHGTSDARAVYNGIRAAQGLVASGFLTEIAGRAATAAGDAADAANDADGADGAADAGGAGEAGEDAGEGGRDV